MESGGQYLSLEEVGELFGISVIEEIHDQLTDDEDVSFRLNCNELSVLDRGGNVIYSIQKKGR